MPRIVVLDGFTLNPGDLDWQPIAALGDLTIHDRTPPELVLDRARHADIVLTNKAPLPAAVIDALPDLRCIGVLATGFNVVDTAAARRRGIPVVNVPGYGTNAVAQEVVAASQDSGAKRCGKSSPRDSERSHFSAAPSAFASTATSIRSSFPA